MRLNSYHLFLLFLNNLVSVTLFVHGQECAVHKEKSKQCGASGSVLENCCEGLICNKKKNTCKQEKCAKVNKRSKECRSPSGLSKCCDGLVCSYRKRRCVEPITPSPTVSPSNLPTQIETASPSVPFQLSRPNEACKNEKKNLGKSLTNVEQCIAAAKADSSCTGSEIMWSDAYNKWWGCRCCSAHPTCPAESSEYYSNYNWDTYSYRECQTLPSNIKPNKACYSQRKNLGTSFSSAEKCAAAAKADASCDGNEIMWSDGYNYSWGCRCCSPHPTCPVDPSRYKNNDNWDIYEYEECS